VSDQLPAALQYLALGWQPVAAPLKGKQPTRSWKRYQTERVVEREVREMFVRPQNVFLITGSVSGLVVLDCDNEAAYEYWKEVIGDELDQTTAVRTGNGYHFYFRLPQGVVVRNASFADDDVKWDIRGEGGGVVAPPSVHESGRVYCWIEDRGPSALRDLPRALVEHRKQAESGQTSVRSMLTWLLQNVPVEGGRNNWLSQVAGHYAKHIPHKDAFEHLVRDAAAKLAPPLPEEEIHKLIESIWGAEQAKEGKAAPDVGEDGEDAWRAGLLQPSEDTGWLASGGQRILVQTRVKKGDEWHVGLNTWLDCDIRVLGVVEGEHDQTYGVELRYPGGGVAEDHLPAKVISDYRALNAWLAAHGASIGEPDTMWPSKMRATTRLLRYLRAQGAQPMVAADALGWHKESEAFVTHEGIIRSTGPSGFEHVRPDPSIKGWAPYRYGHAGRSEAAGVLREVLSFHDERVAAVFGSWWAACFLKPQIQERTSQFPFMALEASSESGKTTGFFSLLLQLSGYTAGQSNPTRAALRDYLSAHHNGIIWVDDLDDLNDLGELLRNVTVGGSLVKKGQENHSQVVAQLRAALVVSGESLGLQDQKALVDRAILLDVPSPVGRRSHHGDYPQWDDIVSLRNTHPDLTEFAGSLVEMALAEEELVSGIKDLRNGTGRYADALAVVRLGSRLLTKMVGGGTWIIDAVEKWATERESAYSGKENVLTMKLLPLALANTGWLAKPMAPDPDRKRVVTPAFVTDDATVWFSPKLLAAWWEREPPTNKRLNPRVESATALEQQAREMGLGGKKGVGRKDFKLVAGDGTQRYWKCDEELSRTLLARSRGEIDGGVIDDQISDQLQ
jgi:hypothetical protein